MGETLQPPDCIHVPVFLLEYYAGLVPDQAALTGNAELFGEIVVYVRDGFEFHNPIIVHSTSDMAVLSVTKFVLFFLYCRTPYLKISTI